MSLKLALPLEKCKMEETSTALLRGAETLPGLSQGKVPREIIQWWLLSHVWINAFSSLLVLLG